MRRRVWRWVGMHKDDRAAAFEFLEDGLQSRVSQIHAVGVREKNNTIQMIDGGTPDLDQDLVACNRRYRYIVEHQLPTVFQQSDSFHASSLFARTDCKRGKSRDALPPRTAPRSTSFNADCCNHCLDFAAMSRRW